MRTLPLFSLLFLTPLLGCSPSAPKPNKTQDSSSVSPPAILGQYVGDWTSDVTSKPAAWTPKQIKYRTLNHAKFILSDKFLQHIEVSHEIENPKKVGKVLFLWGYDSTSKEFVGWSFYSSGIIVKNTGTWDSATKTLRTAPAEPPPNTTVVLTEAFPDENTINGALVFKGNDGETKFDMAWTRTRQKEGTAKQLQDDWSEIGIPPEPLPDELKKIEFFVGEWDTEFINRPSVVSPRGGQSKGLVTAKWILDGRFLYGTTKVGKHKSIWVIGYDTNKKSYRYVRFTDTGLIDESIGQWHEDTSSLVWQLVNTPPNITRTSTSRFVGNDELHTNILAKDKDGKVHMDLTIQGTRKN